MYPCPENLSVELGRQLTDLRQKEREEQEQERARGEEEEFRRRLEEVEEQRKKREKEREHRDLSTYQKRQHQLKLKKVIGSYKVYVCNTGRPAIHGRVFLVPCKT